MHEKIEDVEVKLLVAILAGIVAAIVFAPIAYFTAEYFGWLERRK
jgi:hypothetical protein